MGAPSEVWAEEGCELLADSVNLYFERMPEWLSRTWGLMISQCQDITASSFFISLSCWVWPSPLLPSPHMVFKHYQPKSVILCVGIQYAISLIQTISQAYCLKHTDVKICLVITSKCICSYHFPYICGGRKKNSLEILLNLLLVGAQNLKCRKLFL